MERVLGRSAGPRHGCRRLRKHKNLIHELALVSSSSEPVHPGPSDDDGQDDGNDDDDDNKTNHNPTHHLPTLIYCKVSGGLGKKHTLK